MQQMMFTVENKVEKLLNWCFQFFSQTEHLYSPQVVAKTKKRKKYKQTKKQTADSVHKIIFTVIILICNSCVLVRMKMECMWV